MEPRINKEIFLQGQICPTKGWYYFHGNQQQHESSEADKLRMEEGIQIGAMARQLYPTGILIQQHDMVSASKATLERLKNSQILFEAAFQTENYATRADILIKKDQMWHLLEVKSCVDFENKKVGEKQQYIDDIAYTYLIASQFVPINKLSIISLAKNYSLGMPAHKFFLETDVTNVAKFRASEFARKKNSFAKEIMALNIPESEWKYACKACEFFTTECLGKNINGTIFEITRIGEANCLKLFKQQCYQIKDIPADYKLSAVQKRIQQTVKNNKIYCSSELKDSLAAIKWPVYYLDFETVKTALPLYQKINPHEQVLTQYSIHRLENFSEQPEHFAYLAEPTRDCRRELAKKLIEYLGDAGDIIVYSSFEKSQLSRLKNYCPELAAAIDAVINRLVDLQAIIQRSYYDPRFCGSYSIKKVLPVLVEGVNYDHLAIKNGDMAISSFVKLARNTISLEEANVLKQQLLDYCQQDTLAMLLLHKQLATVCGLIDIK